MYVDVDVDIITQSKIVSRIISDVSKELPAMLPISNVTSVIMEKVIEWCTWVFLFNHRVEVVSTNIMLGSTRTTSQSRRANTIKLTPNWIYQHGMPTFSKLMTASFLVCFILLLAWTLSFTRHHRCRPQPQHSKTSRLRSPRLLPPSSRIDSRGDLQDVQHKQ